jgi:hypothetical protein
MTNRAVLDRTTRIAGSMFLGGEAVVVLMQGGLARRSRNLSIEPEGDDWEAKTAIESGNLLWIQDARLDPRGQKELPLTEPRCLRAWIAVPIQLQDGTRPGGSRRGAHRAAAV